MTEDVLCWGADSFRDGLSTIWETCMGTDTSVELIRYRKQIRVMTDGTSGLGWTDRFKRKGLNLGITALRFLLSDAFCPTSDVETLCDMFVIPYHTCGPRTFTQVWDAVRGVGCTDLSVEAACILYERYGNGGFKQLGLQNLTVLHDPIRGYGFSSRCSLFVELSDCLMDISPVDSGSLQSCGSGFVTASPLAEPFHT